MLKIGRCKRGSQSLVAIGGSAKLKAGHGGTLYWGVLLRAGEDEEQATAGDEENRMCICVYVRHGVMAPADAWALTARGASERDRNTGMGERRRVGNGLALVGRMPIFDRIYPHPCICNLGLKESPAVRASPSHGSNTSGAWLHSPNFLYEDATTTRLSCDILICSGPVQMLTPPPDDGGIDAALTATTAATTTAIDKQCDWTAALPQTDHIRFFRNTDWSRSLLGPLHTWSPTLRLFATYVLVDSRAGCLWWGDDITKLTAIYNEHYAPLAAGAHPRLMGSIFQDGYPELWSVISPYFEQAKRTGAGVNYSSDFSTLVERHGYREEAFFSGGFVPTGMPGAVEGFTNTV